MIFGELRFYALVAAAWIAFFGLPRRLRPAVLTVSGLVFYAVFAASALWIVAPAILVTYLFGRGRTAMGTVIALVIALAAIKALAMNGQSVLPSAGGVAVPLGLSFLTFELIHVAVERRHGRIAAMSLVDLTAFALFFPCRVAGPIRRYPAFMRAVAEAAPSGQDVYRGMWRLLLGLAKKQLLAEPLRLAVAVWPAADTPVAAWRGLIACSLWIYLDFSAYSDIAIGVSRLFGIEVPENFRWPYWSVNIKEFWERWHISLSQWIRDYVFVPLGRVLYATPLRARPVLLALITFETTFLIVGAWHGLGVNFLIWGAYHGLLLGAHHLYSRRAPAWLTEWPPYQSRVATLASRAVTWGLVTVGWVPFVFDARESARMLGLLAGVGR
jgi:alginate O-acetyltransferase complex protein AlgI